MKNVPVFSEMELVKLKASNRLNLHKCDGAGKLKFAAFIWDALKDRARAAGKNPNAVLAPGEKLLKWVRSQIAPVVVKKARTQNERRRHVLNDYLTHVSMTACFIALVWNGKLPEEGDVCSLLFELLFNTDALSVLLRSDKRVTRRCTQTLRL